ncbi:MAG: sialidase family protein [Saprospiraceae bacterium]
MMKYLLSTLLIVSGLSSIVAQKFWLTTYSFPGGPKTSIAGLNDSILLTGLTNGILRSTNEGHDWVQVLESGFIFTLHTTPEGLALAGGIGKVFISTDDGVHWDSVDLGHNFPVLRFAHNAAGDLFAITGDSDPVLGYVGAGVFFSDDNGQSWTTRNNGLNNYLSADQIDIDQNGRLYLTTRNEWSNGEGGLFISDDNGLHWSHVDINIDGENVIENNLLIHYTYGLDVSHQDTLYLSIESVAGSAEVRINLCKHLSDVTDPGFWKINKVWNGATWWLDRPLSTVHIAQNGDAYSSVAGSQGFGGGFFRRNGSAGWERQLQGLGLDIFGLYGTQSFTETASGKIFMVQYLDERVYWADTSQVSSLVEPAKAPLQFRISPNPVVAGSSIRILTDSELDREVVYLIGARGEILGTTLSSGDNIVLNAPTLPGIYWIVIRGRAQGFIVHRE